MSANPQIMPLATPAARTGKSGANQKLVSRETRPDDTIITVGQVTFGPEDFVVIAGPCSVESRKQMLDTADIVKLAGGAVLRGGAFKPRTSPYSFQGLGEEGLKLLAQARLRTGLPIVTEVMDTQDMALVESYTDILQVGARNIQNFCLLRAVGQARKPVLLKRGLMTTVDELLMSAEYIMAAGNHRVILCERGIRTFETATRNTLDLSVVPVLKEKTHLPVVVDPSHAVGHRRWVAPLAKAALAVGADGVMIEAHVDPDQAWCDGDQSLRPQELAELLVGLRAMAPIFNRRMIGVSRG
jgi:3-deoxy-7-phosphoheptulonate synthase